MFKNALMKVCLLAYYGALGVIIWLTVLGFLYLPDNDAAWTLWVVAFFGYLGLKVVTWIVLWLVSPIAAD